MPWLVYHFWASSFQKAHQLPHVALLKLASDRYEEYKETVQKTKEQLKNEISVTFAVKFPKWVELLSDNFNYAIVDNIAVPNYNIKKAYKHLQEKFDQVSIKKEIIYLLELIYILRSNSTRLL